ncbi:hypothetical protein HYT55_04990 [Candidatus Woesearchaeota archaeon]|nr:hypothetical protein [Candidatus Woesearchaeota archaeon]
MGQNLDDAVSTEISYGHVAKNLAPFLRVTIPEAPPEWHKLMRNVSIAKGLTTAVDWLHSAYCFIFRPKEYEMIQEEQREEKEGQRILKDYVKQLAEEDEKELERLGLTTEIEKQAFSLVDLTSFKLHSFYHAEFGLAEVTNTPDAFRDAVRGSIIGAIHYFEEDYWIPLPGVQKPEIVNASFVDKATTWLNEEIRSRTSDGRQYTLLEKIMIRRDEEANFKIRACKRAVSS